MEQFESQPIESTEGKQAQELWDTKLEELKSRRDKLDHPVDVGIQETVAAFLVNKFPTFGSCEGHVEERFDKMVKLRPYIAVGFDEPEQRFVGEAEIKNHIATQFNIQAEAVEGNSQALTAYYNYIEEHVIPETSEYLAVRTKNEELQKRAEELLRLFYTERQTPEELHLGIKKIDAVGQFYITTMGEDREIALEKNEVELYQKELAREQEEIRALTQFLKDRFFNSGAPS